MTSVPSIIKFRDFFCKQNYPMKLTHCAFIFPGKTKPRRFLLGVYCKKSIERLTCNNHFCSGVKVIRAIYRNEVNPCIQF